MKNMLVVLKNEDVWVTVEEGFQPHRIRVNEVIDGSPKKNFFHSAMVPASLRPAQLQSVIDYVNEALLHIPIEQREVRYY